MNKKFNNLEIWFAPVVVLGFVVLLTMMYGWIDSMGTVTKGEMPEMNLVHQMQVPGRQAHHGRFPIGVGNNQMQLIGNPGYSVGVGSGQNGQMQLIGNPGYSVGVGSGRNGQMQLIGNPTFSAGVGGGQIQLVRQVRPGGPYLGLSLSDVPDVLAKELNIAPDKAVYIKNVLSASPADKAGIRAGDVLLQCDHKAVSSRTQVGRILSFKKPDDVLKLVVNRDGKIKSYHVKLQKYPENIVMAAATRGPIWMGADIQDIDAVMKIQFSLPDTRGAIVSHIVPQSPAQSAGLQTGDVIRRFGETRVRDVRQLESLILKGKPGKQLQLTVLRGGRHLTFPVTLGQKAPGTQKVPFLNPAEMAIEGTWIGMDVSEFSAGNAAALGLPSGTTGVLVGDVESPPATMLGFQAGDVIVGINGVPTPDMKHFVSASKAQNSAVVDVIRGNKHFFITVPPPGFTQQLTQINTGAGNKMRQVAAAMPAKGHLAILAAGSAVDTAVAGAAAQPYLILVDLARNSYAVLGTVGMSALPGMVTQHNITALICSNISRSAAEAIADKGAAIYSGVVGSANEAIGLYESGRLVAMKNR